MTREERIKVCETCKHCQKDNERGILCGLTNEYADFEDKCHLYEPSNKQQAKTRARRIITRMKESSKSSGKGLSVNEYIAIIGTYLFCLISTLVGDDAKPSSIIPLYLAIGFVLVAFICLDYYYLKYKRKKKIFGELTSSAIEQIIKIEGFYPQKRDGIIYFKSDGQTYEIHHNAPKLSIVYRFVYDGTYNLANGVALEVQNAIICGKISIAQLDDDPTIIGVTISVETLTHFTDELKLNFASYFQILNDMAALFNDRYTQLLSKREQEQKNSVSRRNEIYCPEYYFIPQLIDDIYNSRLTADVLTDEEWLRQSIRQYCMEHDEKEFIKEWDNFKIQSVNTYGGYKLIIYAYPQPKVIAEALYGGILLNMATRQAQYYTLEYSYDNKWVLGSMNAKGEHNNYGTIDSPNLDHFIAWIFNSNKQKAKKAVN